MDNITFQRVASQFLAVRVRVECNYPKMSEWMVNFSISPWRRAWIFRAKGEFQNKSERFTAGSCELRENPCKVLIHRAKLLRVKQYQLVRTSNSYEKTDATFGFSVKSCHRQKISIRKRFFLQSDHSHSSRNFQGLLPNRTSYEKTGETNVNFGFSVKSCSKAKTL